PYRFNPDREEIGCEESSSSTATFNCHTRESTPSKRSCWAVLWLRYWIIFSPGFFQPGISPTPACGVVDPWVRYRRPKPNDAFPLSGYRVVPCCLLCWPTTLWKDEPAVANAPLLSPNYYSFPKVTLRKHLTKPFSPAVAGLFLPMFAARESIRDFYRHP